jgi:hypothetical protein
MYGIRSLYKRAWQGSLVPFLFFPHFCHVKTHCFFLQEEAVLSHHLGAQSGPHQTDKPADSLILDFSASRAVRNQFWFFFFYKLPTLGILLQQHKQTKTWIHRNLLLLSDSKTLKLQADTVVQSMKNWLPWLWS